MMLDRAMDGFRILGVLRTVVLLFFIWLMFASGTGKLLDMPGFYAVVATYRMMPEALIPPAAWALTLFEIGMGVALVLQKTRARAALLLLPLHLFYLMGMSQALLRGLKLPNCGCFGVYWARPLTPWSLVEDAVLLALAVFLWTRLHQEKEASDGASA